MVLFSPTTPSDGGIYGLDKIVHVGLFAALAVTTRLRFGRGLPLVLGYAVLSEALQAVLPLGRSGGVLDAWADIAGALAGWLAVAVPDRVMRRERLQR